MKNNTEKLSKTQAEAFELLKSGWTILYSGYIGSMPASVHLQKGKAGHGGESKKMNMSVFKALKKKDLIEEYDRPRIHIVYFRLKKKVKD